MDTTPLYTVTIGNVFSWTASRRETGSDTNVDQFPFQITGWTYAQAENLAQICSTEIYALQSIQGSLKLALSTSWTVDVLTDDEWAQIEAEIVRLEEMLTALGAPSQPTLRCRTCGEGFWTRSELDAHKGRDTAPTGAEFKVARTRLGVTTAWLAATLGVKNERTLQRWEAGARPDEAKVAVIDLLLAKQAGEVDRQVALVEAMEVPVMSIPRKGERDGWPAGWWASVAAQVGDRVAELRIIFTEG